MTNDKEEIRDFIRKNYAEVAQKGAEGGCCCGGGCKPGGRLSTSDVVAKAQLPRNIKQDLALIASCIGGAEYVEDIKAMLQAAGFKDIRMAPKENSSEIVGAWAPGKNIEDFVASYVIEAVKEDDKVKISKSTLNC